MSQHLDDAIEGLLEPLVGADDARRVREQMLAAAAGSTPPRSYAASPIKRGRATKAEMQDRRERLYDIVSEGQPMSVRHAYYRAVVAGLVSKDDSGYNKVQRALAEMRLEGELPFGWISDNTRWMRKPTTYNSVEDALTRVARYYRRDLWADADVQLEVWCESDSIAGVIFDVTSKWDVPLMPVRGFSSLTFAHGAAAAANADGRGLVVYYVGDLDPAGVEIENSLRGHLQTWLHVPSRWERIGVTWDQVEEHALPGTPPKKAFQYPQAVEAEALPAPLLRDLLEEAIVQHVDGHQLRVLQAAEESERELLLALAGGAR